MNELQVFSNPDFGEIRTVTVDDAPWFVGKDVAVALGYSNTRKAVIDHVDPEDKGVTNRDTPSGTQQMTIINESGLYSLILSSKLPSAKKFKRWVTSEVLPALRKTGKYEMPQTAIQRPITPDDYIRAASIIATCKTERLPYTLQLLERAGIDVSLPPKEFQKKAMQTGKDITTAKLINLVCNDYGVSLRAIARSAGLEPTQISRIRNGSSFPRPERAALIRDAIQCLVPEFDVEAFVAAKNDPE